VLRAHTAIISPSRQQYQHYRHHVLSQDIQNHCTIRNMPIHPICFSTLHSPLSTLHSPLTLTPPQPNYPGRSSHICNAGFLVHESARGQGVGRILGEAYLKWAPQLVCHSSLLLSLGHAVSRDSMDSEEQGRACRDICLHSIILVCIPVRAQSIAVQHALATTEPLTIPLSHYQGYIYSVFNLVYVSNVASCRLWDSLGFDRIGTSSPPTIPFILFSLPSSFPPCPQPTIITHPSWICPEVS